MNKHQATHDILAHALPLVPFEGWNQPVLSKATQAAGYQKTDSIRVFPGGAIQAVDFFMRALDDALENELQHYSLDTMKIRERITTCVRVKLTVMEPYREAVRKAIALHALPLHCHHGLKSLYHTVDTIWHATGDTSTDFNFYSKRLILAGVYSATMLYWLNDQSAGYANTHAFLDRRIENVMQFEKAKQQFKGWLKNVIPA